MGTPDDQGARSPRLEPGRGREGHAPARQQELPAESSLLRSWKRWESGAVMPNEFYQPIIAATFGTVTHAMFPAPARHDIGSEVLAMTRNGHLGTRWPPAALRPRYATIDALRITADRLCREYPYMPAEQLLTEGRGWLRQITQALGQRPTLKQHRDILVQAGWITLLIGCVEYDSGNRQAAETTRQAALSLGLEADHAEIQAWAHEIRAWMNSHHRRLPRRRGSCTGRHGRSPAPQRGSPTSRARSQSVGTDWRPTPDRSCT